MSLRLEYAAWFDADIHFRLAWYAEQSGHELSDRFISALEVTVQKLREDPSRGKRRYPKDPDLHELHGILLEHPFEKHILFYRFTAETLILERLIHGARDLPRRLRDSPYESE
jgi:plasmid stabilization system protein ParE